MWRIMRGERRKEFIRLSAFLMRDCAAFYAAMSRALTEWPRSCEHNLTSLDSNRIAWLGHAGNCIAHQSPEEATRAAWHLLNPREQDAANAAAARVLAIWDSNCLADLPLFAWARRYA